MSTQPTPACGDHKPWLTRLVPALDWLRHYERKHLPGDALAGLLRAEMAGHRRWVCRARPAWAKNRSHNTYGRAMKVGRIAFGTVKVTKKYGTGRSRAVCFCVHSAVRKPPQGGHERWWKL